MGDRTALQITIYDCPENEVNAVLDVLEEYGLAEDWDIRSASSLPELQLGETYVVNEASCGSSDEIATHLENKAPGTSFEVWEDPKYEWLGSLNRYTPTLGAFGAECDADGQPQWTADVILKLIDDAEELDDIKKSLGVPWSDALAQLATANEGKKIIRPDEEAS